MNFLPPDIQRYAEQHTTGEGPLLCKIERDTQLKVLMPRMLSGHLQGRMLSMLSHMIKPRRVLEVGTYTAYATLCIAEGLSKDGIIHTIDKNEEIQDIAQGYINESPFADKIKLHIGNALDLIPTLEDTYDIVFIDADKVNYAAYYEMVIPMTRKGGYIITDNVLWSGKVTTPPKTNDKVTIALLEFNKMVHNDPRVENVLLPIRDGLLISRIL